MSDDRRYLLEISEKQAHVISKACEVLARLYMGQFGVVRDCFLTRALSNEISDKDWEHLQDLLHTCETLATGLPRHGYFGIHSPAISDKARVSFDIHRVVRHRLAWDRQPTGGFGVDFDAPRATSELHPLLAVVKGAL